MLYGESGHQIDIAINEEYRTYVSLLKGHTLKPSDRQDLIATLEKLGYKVEDVEEQL